MGAVVVQPAALALRLCAPQTSDWPVFLDCLVDFNRGWAQHASALVFIASNPFIPGADRRSSSPTHSFDTGAAWAFLSLQAHGLGLRTHAMAGFDRDRAAAELSLPAGWRLEAAVAVGRQGDPERLPPHLREREHPSHRKPLEEVARQAGFPCSNERKLSKGRNARGGWRTTKTNSQKRDTDAMLPRLGLTARQLSALALNAALGAAIFSAPGTAWAQAAAADASSVAGAQIDELVVTAQRRSERVSDVPMSVSAVTGEALAKSGVVQPTQLSNLVTGLNFQNTGPTAVFAIRGITLNDFGDSNESPVAFYRDDVYIAALGGTLFQMFDIGGSRCFEAARHLVRPQRGRRPHPGHLQQARRDLRRPGQRQFGSYSQLMATVAIDLPLDDRVRTRTAVTVNHDNGCR